MYVKCQSWSTVKKASVMLSRVLLSRVASFCVASAARLRSVMSCIAPWMRTMRPSALRAASPMVRTQKRRPVAEIFSASMS